MELFRTAPTKASIWIWVALFALVLTRFVFQASRGYPEFIILRLVPVAATVVAFVLVHRGASGIAVYVSAVLAVFGPVVYSGFKTVLSGACSAGDQITSWPGIGFRWLDAVTGILIFSAIAATTGLPRPLIPGRFPRRAVWTAGLSLIGVGFGAYLAANVISDAFQSAIVDVPGAWSACKEVTSEGLDNAALETSLALVSGVQEEVVFTGVALLLLGAAARWKTVVELALIGGLLRAVLHMHYTIDASWYAVAAVAVWAVLWSGGALLVAYFALRWFGTAGRVAAIVLVTAGVVVSHSTRNMSPAITDLSKEIVSNGSGATGLALSLAWAVVYLGGIVGSGALLLFAVVTRKESHDRPDQLK